MDFLSDYQSTITLVVVGAVVISILFVGLHTDLVEDISDRKKQK